MWRRLSPFVGRTRELAQMSAAHARVVDRGTSELVLIVGEPGIGKSRLRERFVADLPTSTLALEEACGPGADAEMAPVAGVIRGLAGATSDDAAALGEALARTVAGADHERWLVRCLAGVLALDDPTYASDWPIAVRRLVEHVARRGPVVITIDDVHDASADLIELLSTLGARAPAPVLVLATARPSVADVHPRWSVGPPGGTRIRLGPLDPADLATLVQVVVGPPAVPDETAARLVGPSEGNPLFVEETLAYLVAEGALTQVDETWRVTGPLDTIVLPPSIRSLVDSRLVLLSPAERVVLDAAAVAGTWTRRSLVERMLADDDDAQVALRLWELQRRDLLTVAEGGAAEGIGFRHASIREVVLDAIPHDLRAGLHLAAADAIEAEGYGPRFEVAERTGAQLEAAIAARAAAGLTDIPALRVRAASLLTEAGLVAIRMGRLVAGAELFERTLALGSDSLADLEALNGLAAIAGWEGDMSRHEELARRATEAARIAGDERLLLAAELQLGFQSTYGANPEPAPELVRAAALRARDVFVGPGDEWYASMALMHLFNLSLTEGDAALAGRYGAETARLGVRAASTAGCILYPLLFGQAPLADVLRRADALGLEHDGDPEVAGIVAYMRAECLWRLGRFDEARDRIAVAEAMLTEVRQFAVVQLTGVTRALIGMAEGGPEVAVAALASAAERVRAAGMGDDVSLAEVPLARCLARLGRDEEAASVCARARSTLTTCAHLAELTAIEAGLAARSGDRRAPAASADAIRLAASTDFLESRAAVALDAGEVAALTGDLDAARRHADEAVAMYARKGHGIGVGWARAAIGRWAGQDSNPRHEG